MMAILAFDEADAPPPIQTFCLRNSDFTAALPVLTAIRVDAFVAGVG